MVLPVFDFEYLILGAQSNDLISSIHASQRSFSIKNVQICSAISYDKTYNEQLCNFFVKQAPGQFDYSPVTVKRLDWATLSP